MPKVNKSNWRWFGRAGHFSGSERCLFHLHTHVGRYCVSTVGEYYPYPSREEGGEMREMSAHPGMFYETMVFLLDPRTDSPVDHNERDVRRYATLEEAQAGHVAMCELWAERAANGKAVG